MEFERSDDESLVFEAVVPAAKVRCLDWRSYLCQCQREGGEIDCVSTAQLGDFA